MKGEGRQGEGLQETIAERERSELGTMTRAAGCKERMKSVGGSRRMCSGRRAPSPPFAA